MDTLLPSRGLFNQSGGLLASSHLQLDMIPPDVFAQHNSQFDQNVTYSLSGGTLTSTNESIDAGGLSDAFLRTGFIHNGGVNNVGSLSVGDYEGALGWYRLQKGTLNAGSESLGAGGTALFVQEGGTHIVSGTLSIGTDQDGSGLYDFYGGTLNAAAIDVNATGALYCLGSGTILGSLNIKKGTLGVYNDLQIDANINFDSTAITQIDANLTATGTVTVNGAVLNGSGTLSVAPSGTLRGSGTVEIIALNNAGTIAADIGALVIESPTLTNTGTIKNLPGASLFVKSPSFTNNGIVAVNGAGAVNFDPPVTNSAGHLISLLGGVLSAPSVTNSLGGTISGFGQITGNLTNSGSVSFIGPTQIVGNFANNAGGVVAVRNAQTLIIGVSSNAGTITTSNGTIIFDGGIAQAPPAQGAPLGDGPGGLDGAGTLLVNPGAHLISSYVRQSALVVGGTVAASGIAIIRDRADGGDFSVLDSVGISGTSRAWKGVLDLADNDLIVHTTPIASIADYISTGFDGGDWQGLGISSAIAAQVAGDAHKTALGYAAPGSIGVGSFDGQSVVGSTALVRYTYSGDANLDGAVDTTDFARMAAHFGSTTTLWSDGDFNYDGVVNALDFNALATNFGQAMSAPALGALVPEPTSPLVLISFIALRRRNHPRSARLS